MAFDLYLHNSRNEILQLACDKRVLPYKKKPAGGCGQNGSKSHCYELVF